MADLKEMICSIIDSMRERLIEISSEIHKNPELGFKEYKASKLLASELGKHGFKVEMGICGLPTAFKATYYGRGNGPKIAFLAEYDALPKLGHACGHNIIGTSAIGAAIALSKVMENFNGEIIVFGTPAEEGYVENAGGKVIMLDEIAKADVALMIHPSDTNSVACSSLAREAFRIEFFGKAAHAAGAPHKGVNALEALILTFVSINALRQHLKKDAMIHGIIEKGGDAPNIVPDYASGRFYARAETVEYLMEVVEKIKKCAEGAALQTGAKMKFTKTANTYANIIPNEVLAKIAFKNFKFLGVEFESIEELSKRRGKGSTDFGNVSQLIPAIEILIKICPEGTPGHSAEFAKAAGSELGHEGLIVGVKVLALTALDLIINPKLIDEAKKELIERKEQLSKLAKA